jgi:hypothetical protein
VKVEPLPGALSNVIEPLSSSTNFLVIDKPRPLPSNFYEFRLFI